MPVGRPRTPTAKAKLTGAAAKDPQRYRDRKEPDGGGPLGDAPEFLNELQKQAWYDYRLRWPWVTQADAPQLAALCKLRVKIEYGDDGDWGAATINAYRLLTSEFGGTPVSRSKIFQPKEEEKKDPFADFAN